MSLTGAQTAIDENKQVLTISLVDVRVTLLPLSSVETGTRVFFFTLNTQSETWDQNVYRLLPPGVSKGYDDISA